MPNLRHCFSGTQNLLQNHDFPVGELEILVFFTNVVEDPGEFLIPQHSFLCLEKTSIFLGLSQLPHALTSSYLASQQSYPWESRCAKTWGARHGANSAVPTDHCSPPYEGVEEMGDANT